MNILEQNYCNIFLNCFFNRSKKFYQLKYIIQNHIVLFLFLRKFSKKYNLDTKIIEILYFTKYLDSNFLVFNLIDAFQNQVLIELTSLIFFKFKIHNIKLTKKLFVKKDLYKLSWMIKKEYSKLQFNKLNFFELFDKINLYILNKKIVFNFFKYYELNNNLYLKNKKFFQKVFFIYTKVYFIFFDKFIFYLNKKCYLIFKKTICKRLTLDYGQKNYCLSLLNFRYLFYYVRFNTSFILNIFLNSSYLKQLNQELIYFINTHMKLFTKNHCFSLINSNINVNFIGFQLFFNPTKFLSKADLNKILFRFFLVNYNNKFKSDFSKFTQYLLIKQYLFLIKLKLILQSIVCYFKFIKNKNYLILQITLILKVFIIKLLNKKYFFKSRKQIFDFFRKDLSKFIIKRFS